jgi:hypothetical protein
LSDDVKAKGGALKEEGKKKKEEGFLPSSFVLLP